MKTNILSFKVGMLLYDTLERLEGLNATYDLFQRYFFDQVRSDMESIEEWTVIVRLLNGNLLIIQFDELQRIEYTLEVQKVEFPGLLATNN